MAEEALALALLACLSSSGCLTVRKDPVQTESRLRRQDFFADRDEGILEAPGEQVALFLVEVKAEPMDGGFLCGLRSCALMDRDGLGADCRHRHRIEVRAVKGRRFHGFLL